MAVAELRFAAEGLFRCAARNPVHIPKLHAAMEQILARAENDCIILWADLADEVFLREAQSQSPVLADGVADDAAVPP